MRKTGFRYRCLQENILKVLWRFGDGAVVPFEKLQRIQTIPALYQRFILMRLQHHGWLRRVDSGYQLTSDGAKRGAHIIRLHRLWEVYLAEYLGVGAERVHYNAEEMEHILTPEIEKDLEQRFPSGGKG